jgi:hypothetical protein
MAISPIEISLINTLGQTNISQCISQVLQVSDIEPVPLRPLDHDDVLTKPESHLVQDLIATNLDISLIHLLSPSHSLYLTS